jgi:ADP-ribose pyrophosphatase YjhB (NUDIX family)
MLRATDETGCLTMPHIHELIDFTVEAFVVHAERVLLVYHRQLHKWLPLGGHIELDEDPEQALFREIAEESGLEVEILSQKPAQYFEGRKFLYPPVYLDVHPITSTHQHIGLVYFAKAASDQVTLAAAEHEAIRWFSEAELRDPAFDIQPDILFYADEALRLVAKTSFPPLQ